MARFNCYKCGEAVDTSKYWKERALELEIASICNTCKFWFNKMFDDIVSHKGSFVIANGSHYIIGDENSADSFRGFYGAKFTVKFFDGRVVKTSNLWHQGEIPEVFKAEMPDNAELINGWE